MSTIDDALPPSPPAPPLTPRLPTFYLLGMNFKQWLLATSAMRWPQFLAQIAYSDRQLAAMVQLQNEQQSRIARALESGMLQHAHSAAEPVEA